jgi:hypothetical protein
MDIYTHLVVNCGWTVEAALALKKEDEEYYEINRKKKLQERLEQLKDSLETVNTTELEDFDF